MTATLITGGIRGRTPGNCGGGVGQRCDPGPGRTSRRGQRPAASGDLPGRIERPRCLKRSEATTECPASPLNLIAGMPHGAIDIRVHAGIVKRTGSNSYRDRTCRATAEGSTEIAALPGGDTTDDQPDSKEYRPYVHLDLLSIRCVKYRNIERRPVPIAGIHSVRHLGGSLPGRGDFESGARESDAFSRNLEVRLAATVGNGGLPTAAGRPVSPPPASGRRSARPRPAVAGQRSPASGRRPAVAARLLPISLAARTVVTACRPVTSRGWLPTAPIPRTKAREHASRGPAWSWCDPKREERTRYPPTQRAFAR